MFLPVATPYPYTGYLYGKFIRMHSIVQADLFRRQLRDIADRIKLFGRHPGCCYNQVFSIFSIFSIFSVFLGRGLEGSYQQETGQREAPEVAE